jgi:ubiquinone/menaquinone biosynthesis C-methylase UbiE
VGCGVGAQTITLATNSPHASITAVDIAQDSLAEAARRVTAAGIQTVHFEQADLWSLPYAPESFDHLFICFVLEHLSAPVAALEKLQTHLRPGGTITVIEGDHGSTYFYPESTAAHQAIQCQVTLQQQAGGNALIGRALFPLLQAAGYRTIRVSPRMVYVDSSKPELVEGFTKQTFTAMIEGVREAAVHAGIIAADVFDQGIRDLYRTTAADGVFCYTFFKAIATR